MADPIKLPPGATLINDGMKLPPGATLVSDSPDASASPKGYGSTALDVIKGLGEGVVHTLSSADRFATKHLPAFMTTPIGQAATPENSARATTYAQDIATPTNTAQKIGRGIEQAGEFLIPGGAEGAMASKLAPSVGKVAAKLGTAALGSGVVNATQGGSFLGGAAAGGAGAGLGIGLQKIAPVLAETALKVRGTDRAYGSTPGRAVLDLTKGIRPAAVVDSARESLSNLGGEADALAAAHPNLIDLTPTRTAVGDSLDVAKARNYKGTVKDLEELGNQINTEYATGAAIPSHVSASRAVELKRGVGDFRNFSPSGRTGFGDAAAGTAYHNLGQEINTEIPEMAPLNQKMQSLMTVIPRANAADLNAGVMQKVISRFGAHSGALTVGGLGAGAGYKEGGVPGAILGGVLGLGGAEMLASPETSLAAARLFNSGAIKKAAPAVTGLGLQLNR